VNFVRNLSLLREMVPGESKTRCAAARQSVESCDDTALANADVDSSPSTVGVSDILKDLLLEPPQVSNTVKLPDTALRDAEDAKRAMMASIPTPNRCRAPIHSSTQLIEVPKEIDVSLPAPVVAMTLPCLQSSQRGPTPWDMTAESGFQSQRYRDQLRVSGQQALQRARDHGLVPKAPGSSSGASTPSSSAVPLPLSIFGALNTQPTSSDPGAQFRGNERPQPQPQQHVQYQVQPAFFQSQVFFQSQQTCFQPQQAFFVTQVPPMMGFQTSGPMMSAQVQSQLPCREQRQVANSAPSPATGFDLNSEQMAEMLKRAEEDIYED